MTPDSKQMAGDRQKGQIRNEWKPVTEQQSKQQLHKSVMRVLNFQLGSLIAMKQIRTKAAGEQAVLRSWTFGDVDKWK